MILILPTFSAQVLLKKLFRVNLHQLLFKQIQLLYFNRCIREYIAYIHYLNHVPIVYLCYRALFLHIPVILLIDCLVYYIHILNNSLLILNQGFSEVCKNDDIFWLLPLLFLRC